MGLPRDLAARLIARLLFPRLRRLELVTCKLGRRRGQRRLASHLVRLSVSVSVSVRVRLRLRLRLRAVGL